MIQTSTPQPPRTAYEIRQYLHTLSRDMGAVYKEFKQHMETLIMLQIAAYAELERIEARSLETFNWPAQPQPPVRVVPVTMPPRPQITHLHAGQQPGNAGRMRFVEEAEAPTLPDPWVEGGRHTNG